MTYLNLDTAIIIIFLSFNLIIGLYYGMGVENIKTYALGGRNFSTNALVATIVATSVTGSMFLSGLSRGYTLGLYDVLPTCGYAFSLMITAKFLIPKMQSFLGDISVADSMRRLYGGPAGVITAICSIMATIGAIAVQFKVFGIVINFMLGFNSIFTIIFAGTIVTLYSSFGGIRSVTITDIFQFFIVFGIIVPLIGVVIWQSMLDNNQVESITSTLAAPHFNITSIFDSSKLEFWEMLFIGIYMTTPMMYPEIYQRILMSKSTIQAQRAFKISFWIMLFVIICIGWIAFELYTINTNLDPSTLLSYIFDNYGYRGIKGTIVIAVISMAMSSADSFINVCSVMFVHDICKPLNLVEKNNQKQLLTYARYSSLTIGFSSIIIAFMSKGIFDMVLFGNAFYIPVVTAPLLCTILGFRTGEFPVLSSMIIGFMTVILWRSFEIKFDPILPAMSLSFITLMMVHYLTKTPGGWGKDSDDYKKTSKWTKDDNLYI